MGHTPLSRCLQRICLRARMRPQSFFGCFARCVPQFIYAPGINVSYAVTAAAKTPRRLPGHVLTSRHLSSKWKRFPFLFFLSFSLFFFLSYFYRSGFKRRQCSRSLSKRYRGWIFPRVTTDDINSSDMCESLYDHLLCLFLRKINDFITQVSIYIFCENVIENIGNGHFDCSNSL